MPPDETHTIDGETVEVYYIAGERNRYKPEENIIILDEELQDWPTAHDVIKQHELDHAKTENQTVVGLLSHELKADLRHYFSPSEEWQQTRTYLNEQPAGGVKPWLLHGGVEFLRGVWTTVFIPLHGVYRGIARVKGVLAGTEKTGWRW